MTPDHRQTTPSNVSFLNRLVLLFLLRQRRKAHLDKHNAGQRLLRYASQLGHSEWANKCLLMDIFTCPNNVQNCPNNPSRFNTNTPPTAPAAPFKSADQSECLSSDMSTPPFADKHNKASAPTHQGPRT